MVFISFVLLCIAVRYTVILQDKSSINQSKQPVVNHEYLKFKVWPVNVHINQDLDAKRVSLPFQINREQFKLHKISIQVK